MRKLSIPTCGATRSPSYEINHVRLLQWLAATGKPLVISTGAATEDDIEFCLEIVREAGSGDITLLQCTSSYPAPPESLNLTVIPWLQQRFGVPAGFSDHSSDPIAGRSLLSHSGRLSSRNTSRSTNGCPARTTRLRSSPMDSGR